MAFPTDVFGEVTVIHASGYIDSATSPDFRAAIMAARDAGVSRIVVDLSTVTYMSSAGLRAMLNARNSGCDLRIAGASGRVQQVFELTGTDRIFHLYASVEDAVASFANTERKKMDFNTETHGDVTVVTLNGNLDGLTSGGVETDLLAMIEDGAANMVIDLSGVAFMSSAGLRALLSVSKGARKAGGDMRLVEGPEGIQKVIKMSGFNNIFKSYADADSAVESFA